VTILKHIQGFLLLVWVLPGQVCADWYKSTQSIMGTEIGVDIWHENTTHAGDCGERVFANMRRIDALMSPYLEQSELYTINANAGREPVKVSDELFSLIKESIRYSVLSSGAFDITFASVGYLYDYRHHKRPADDAIAATLKAIDYRLIQLDENNKTVCFLNKDVRIDLGGIAKGYAIDQAVAILKQCGIKHGYVFAGGDSYILGDRLGQPWVLGIKHPRQEDKTVVRLPLKNVAVSTSGDYERFFMEDDKRYHHILNPGTGKPATGNWSVTVIGDNATMTDALSTTLFVMDLEPAMRLVESLHTVDAIIIDSHGDMHYSSGLMPPGQTKH
jgi:thiamine biosynthesis lipoprotein